MTQAQGSTGRLLAGRYRLVGVLGQGGMGTVWRAEDEMLGRIVAVKELRMHGGVDEDEKHRLIVRTLREAKATARIRHTAAVTVFDVVEEDDRPWIVMELVESRSLAEVIKEDGPVTPSRAAEIALELLGVLGAAHSHGILHRDVKPSNVLIGEDGRVVLTDFGIASVEGDTSVTSTGMLVGAPSYISPERARGQKPGPPADMWSLGGTLYAMVEGKPPYDRGSALATLTAVMTEDLATPMNAGPLRPVIEGLLEKDPAHRLDASTTRSMLKRIVADEIAKAEATTQLKVPAPPAARERKAAATAAAPSLGKTEKDSKDSKDSKVGDKPKDKAGDKARRGVGGLLGTVRVGSRSAEPAAVPVAVPAPVPVPVPAPVSAPAPTAAPGAPNRRPKVIAGVALIVALLLIALAVVLLRDGTGGSAAAKTPAVIAPAAHGTPAAGSAAASSSPSPSAKPSESPTTSPSSSPSSSPSADTSPSPSGSPGAGSAAVPAGYHAYRDDSGFSINLPDWLGAPEVGDNRRTFSGNGSKLVVEWTGHPDPSALKDWQDEASGNNFSNYHQINLAAITYRTWTNAADWEWTFGSSTTLHSLNRGFVTGKYGYAIYWTTPDSQWNAPASVDARKVAFDSFQPAP
ncbi:serine/threonine-protein kinase [Kitasatospora sp. MAP5-34]|uniref:serine/threonine-protein kinase n=1 Tax=Kitasatospora sp. MAP5-34 TaxID=3035102 RepID=UPI00247680AA|nr:serine/threonine-protein kinase [Kitasatospora sp. MAP5-34]MDH6578094.1 hypothetical protein [Kitasatospora sp. MAP5-34]